MTSFCLNINIQSVPKKYQTQQPALLVIFALFFAKLYFAWLLLLKKKNINSCIACLDILGQVQWREGCVWVDFKYKQFFSEIAYCTFKTSWIWHIL